MITRMKCRSGCAACCIAPSISSPIPGMQHGKPAGMRCLQLSDDNRCRIFGSDLRPTVCSRLQPNVEMCGDSASDAMERLTLWELATRPETDTSSKQVLCTSAAPGPIA